MQTTTKIFDKIHTYYQTGKDFEILSDSTNQTSVVITNPAIRLKRLFIPSSREKTTQQVLQLTIQTLKELPRLSPLEASTQSICKVSKHLLKKLSSKGANNPTTTELKTELAAYKLGISTKDLTVKENQGFLKFASRPPLDRYLSEFNHELKISEKGEILILHNNQYISWKQAQRLCQPPPHDPSCFQILTYGMHGIQNSNTFDFTFLTPYKKEDPEQWDCKYIFEFCCCCEKAPRFIGDHSWIRLKTPQGDIYSVGLYRPYKVDTTPQKDPLRIRKGILMQPDISEFWPTPIHRIPFEITQKQFLQIKKQIEEDKIQDCQVLEAFGRNCTEYAEKLALIADIKLPLKKPMWKLLMHKYGSTKITQVAEFLQPILPTEISCLCAKITSFWCAAAISFFGARKIDTEVHKPNPLSIKPRFCTFQDLFDEKKCEVKHPHTLGHDVANWVTKQRAAEQEKLIKQRQLLRESGASIQTLEKLDQEIQNVKFKKVS